MNVNRTLRAAAATLSAAIVAALLPGCGGGGNDSGDGGSTSVAQGYGPGSPANCPHTSQNDAWLNNRLGCLAAGQKFVLVSAGATGDAADREYIVNQRVLDASLNDVLGTDVLRYFEYAVCVRNAPSGLSGVAVASDLATAMGLNTGVSGRTYYPASVSGSTMSFVDGAGTPGVVQAACSASQHPVIVDYSTGLVESVNAGALATLTMYDR